MPFQPRVLGNIAVQAHIQRLGNGGLAQGAHGHGDAFVSAHIQVGVAAGVGVMHAAGREGGIIFVKVCPREKRVSPGQAG